MARVSLGEVALEARETCKGDKSGYPIVGLEHITPEEIQLRNWDDNSENTFTKRFHKGDVLFGRRRAYLKKAALAVADNADNKEAVVKEAIRKVDMACTKGILHKNNAARKKSSLAKSLAK